MFITVAALLLLSCTAEKVPSESESAHRFVILDGDTVLVDDSPVRVSGIDAPELGPWAKCWAEAALAGHARSNLESLLADPHRRWRLIDLSPAEARGKRTGRVVDKEGFDIADDMVVYGYAARTDGSWDWCGENANLHHVLEGEPAPHGPNLWWPSAHVFDARAAD